MATKVTIEITRELLEGLHQVIRKVIADYTGDTDDDRLVLSTLDELRLTLHNRLGKNQLKYTMQLTPAFAFAFRILCSDYVQPTTETQLGSWMFATYNHIAKTYEL